MKRGRGVRGREGCFLCRSVTSSLTRERRRHAPIRSPPYPSATSLSSCSASQQRGGVDIRARGGEQARGQGVHKRVRLVTITSKAEGHRGVAPGEGAVEEWTADKEVVEGVREGEAARKERNGWWEGQGMTHNEKHEGSMAGSALLRLQTGSSM